MTSKESVRPDRDQTVLAAAMLVCYAVGYPVALLAHSPIGWGFVMLGGVLLFLLIFATIRRINRGA
ncbi:MAG: hypothetical protein QOF82_1786 [Frankiales bacterium]|nr:hypothetical protein [Frankiales bacterium]